MQLAVSPMILDAADHAERSLVERARYDRSAFARLYREHYAFVAGYVLRRTGNPDIAEDLVADVFLSALAALPRYRHRGVPFRAWLMRIATNRVNRWARRERPRAMQQLEQAPPAAAHVDRARGEAARVRSALLTLAPRHQTVLALHYYEDLSVEQIARVLGCRAGTVKSRLFRARTILRLRLERRTDR